MTTSTRRPPPMEIYQDPDVSFAARTEHDVETALLNALRPLSDASNKANMALNPTTAPSDGSSPRKQDSSPHRPSSSYHLSEIKISPPHADLYGMSPSKDGSFYPMYHQVNPMPKSLYPVMADKENYDKAAFSHIQEPQFSTELDPYTAPMKRAFIDTSSIRPVKRQRFEDEEDYFDLPDPKDMPPVQDDGTKPTHSYATLIGMAILRAPQRRLTLAQIYKWISDNYTFYQLADAGWQNSIRHNLSLNKNFIKRERPKDDPGKGNYWAIKPGQEKTYITDRKTQLRRLTNPDGSQVFAPDMAGFRPVSAPAIGHFTLAPNPGRKAEIRQVDVAKFPDETELSSDGTIPGSDAGVEDDIDASMMPPPPARIRSSPPPQDFGSSPPTMSSSFRRGTPPPASRFPSTSRSGGRKRKIAALNDSGYFSSIESSAARGATHQLNSELDAVRPRIKKGRAEEEIARIRSSSIDSPSKAHRRANTVHYTSSPAHKEHHPLTPALPLKREAKPPKSNSPTTNLRNHRNRIKALLGSPAKTFSPNIDAHNWSPAFICADDLGLTPGISPLKTAKTPWKFYTGSTDASLALPAQSFDVFVDDDLPARGSPEKRSTKRPSLVRAATSAGILADVTGTSKGNITLTPAEESPFSISPFLLKPDYATNPLASSPLKHCQAASDRSSAAKVTMVSTEIENVRPSDLIAKKETIELFGTELRSDSSEEMIDIFQDFGKIGQMKPLQPVANRGNGSPMKRSMGPPMRPPMLNRAQSNRW